VALLILFSGCSSLQSMLAKGLIKEKATEAEVQPQAAQPERSAGGPAAGSAAWNNAMTAQAQMAFSYAFNAGGFLVGQVGYKPGEYTKFRLDARGEDPVTMERAFLKRLEDGKEWWRVAWTQGEEGLVWEALLEPKSGKMLRLRARDAEGQVGEVPVANDTLYTPAAELTKESVQAATVGSERLETPAGSFQAQHVVYSASGRGKLEWWTSERVPGGVVKYLHEESKGRQAWVSLLSEYGKNATTVLQSY
jgi:hypothetical protein